MKRQREVAFTEAEEEIPVEEENWCNATEVIKLHQEGFDPFPVTFTHQMFQDEVLEGHKQGEVEVLIKLSRGLACCIQVTNPSTGSEIDKDARDAIVERLRPGMPTGYTTSLSAFQKTAQEHVCFVPPGEEVHSYIRKDRSFALLHVNASTKGAVDFHNKVQTLALWYIEAADGIDLSDDRWEVFYIYEKKEREQGQGYGAFAGYFTLYNFRNPIRGICQRICQALLMPSHQRQGHGLEVLGFLCSRARADSAVVEITVEDPAPGFTQLRNISDAMACREAGLMDEWEMTATSSKGGGKKAGAFRCLSREEIAGAAKRLKILPGQVEIAYELLRLSSLPADARMRDSELYKRFRLSVKRRLLRTHQEELDVEAVLVDGVARQLTEQQKAAKRSEFIKEQLALLWADVEPGYLTAAARLQR